jgi:hypothetical protein
MANNLFGNIPAACVSKSTIAFSSAGLDVTNINIIFEVGSPLKSWKPERTINAVTGFTADKGYYIVPKVDLDLTAILVPPLAGGGGGDTTPPTVVSATVQDATHIRLTMSEVVTATAAGHSFKKNGANNGIALMTGSGTNQLDFTLNTAMVAGDTILRSYNSVSGDTADAAANELVSYTDQAVTNGLSGGGTNRRSFAGYLERWEVPADPTDTTKIITRLATPDRFVQRLKGDKHGIATVYDLRQIDSNALEPKFLTAGIEGRPAMQILATQRIFTGAFPGANGLGFPCEMGYIFKIPVLPATGIKYFKNSLSAGTLFDMAVGSDGKLYFYAGGASLLDTNAVIVAGVTNHVVQRREADGTTKCWHQNVLKCNTVHGNATQLFSISLGNDTGDGVDYILSEAWASGSDNGAAPVLPTDSERTSLYNDAKTDFPTLP